MPMMRMFRSCGFAPFLIFTVQPCFGFFHALPFLGQVLIGKVVADAAEAIHDTFLHFLLYADDTVLDLLIAIHDGFGDLFILLHEL